jgi:hypothetical protein
VIENGDGGKGEGGGGAESLRALRRTEDAERGPLSTDFGGNGDRGKAALLHHYCDTGATGGRRGGGGVAERRVPVDGRRSVSEHPLLDQRPLGFWKPEGSKKEIASLPSVARNDRVSRPPLSIRPWSSQQFSLWLWSNQISPESLPLDCQIQRLLDLAIQAEQNENCCGHRRAFKVQNFQ